MWLNNAKIIDSVISNYRKSLLSACPRHIVIDGLFDEVKLDEVMRVLEQPDNWQAQKHTYSSLYVDNDQWQNTSQHERFVHRDIWCRDIWGANVARDFLSFLRGNEFMSLLSRIFNVVLTDVNVSTPEINTNFFRLGSTDFVEQHVDDSPGREVCMLLYLNKEWSNNAGGELSFLGELTDGPVSIAPLYNRCVLFDPSSEGSEHWVKKLCLEQTNRYRYNVTSWYWRQ